MQKGHSGARAVGAVIAGRHGVYFSWGHEKIHKVQRSAWPGECLVCCAP